MLSYLKGTVISVQKVTNSRIILTLEVNQIGYEVQIMGRTMADLPPADETAQLFTHLQVKEDQVALFGFASASERDLFRQLISVSGVGPQLALALLDTLGLQELVQAIVISNTRLLSRTPGVGAKTAERIALELKTKLAEWRSHSDLPSIPDAAPAANVQEDVEMTLLALGYSSGEITQALRSVGQKTALSKMANAEDWIREAIAWLSQ
ncbi:MAG: Holliday junction branch migration protein RuvA [Leptolyngbyaceae cyanobacterium SM1_3_5]|nr:Holliday junction branch migration protein RuvA [Leptolyngbyaceae cyanobacterium SM1_3_5]